MLFHVFGELNSIWCLLTQNDLRLETKPNGKNGPHLNPEC